VRNSRTRGASGQLQLTPTRIKSDTNHVIFPTKRNKIWDADYPICPLKKNRKNVSILIKSGHPSRWLGRATGMNWGVYFEIANSLGPRLIGCTHQDHRSPIIP
jgi:hypothetical protein